MSFNEIVTLAISIIALVVSISALSLQYSVRNDLKFRISNISLNSLQPSGGAPRTFTITLNLSIFNLGNRSISMQLASLRVLDGKFDDLKSRPPSTCEEGGQYITPIERANYNQMFIPATVVGAQEVFSEELVFDLFYHQQDAKAVSIEGVACLSLEFTDSSGSVTSHSLPIAILKVDLMRPDKMLIDFDSDIFGEANALQTVF